MVDIDEVKETIESEAHQVFSKSGFRKTTVDEIASANGKGKSSIYYYFESKKKIFQGGEEKDIEHRLDNLIHFLFHGVMKR
jgi:AcrR family transcriptional regulator